MDTAPVRLGLRENLPQFCLLAVTNLLVDGMVGLERTVTPLVGSEVFGLGDLAIALFVMTFGLTKAITNLVGGAVVGRFTRKRVRPARDHSPSPAPDTAQRADCR